MLIIGLLSATTVTLFLLGFMYADVLQADTVKIESKLNNKKERQKMYILNGIKYGFIYNIITIILIIISTELISTIIQ